MAQNYYDILGVNKGASEKDIKSAYRRMARKLWLSGLGAGLSQMS